MAAYINGDLSEGARRRIARYIDECPDCYNEYIRQRKLANELERKLPAFGRPDAQQLDRIWASIQGELAFAGAGATNSNTHSSHRSTSYTTWSYGLLALAMSLLLLLPIAMSYQASVAIVPSPPQPEISQLEKTPTTVAHRPVVLAAITQPGAPLYSPLLQNTPAPNSGRE